MRTLISKLKYTNGDIMNNTNIIHLSINKAQEQVTEAEKAAIKLLGGTVETRPLRYKIRIVPMDDDINPLEYYFEGSDNSPVLYNNMKEYKLCPNEKQVETLPFFDEDKNAFTDIPALAKKAGVFIIPIYAYIHSGISLSLTRDGQFLDRWDSGLAGYALYKKKPSKEDVALLAQYVKDYNNIQCGLAYSVKLFDEFEQPIDSIDYICDTLSQMTKDILAVYGTTYGIKEADVKEAMDALSNL